MITPLRALFSCVVLSALNVAVAGCRAQDRGGPSPPGGTEGTPRESPASNARGVSAPGPSTSAAIGSASDAGPANSLPEPDPPASGARGRVLSYQCVSDGRHFGGSDQMSETIFDLDAQLATKRISERGRDDAEMRVKSTREFRVPPSKVAEVNAHIDNALRQRPGRDQAAAVDTMACSLRVTDGAGKPMLSLQRQKRVGDPVDILIGDLERITVEAR